jgi:hypothetical protein
VSGAGCQGSGIRAPGFDHELGQAVRWRQQGADMATSKARKRLELTHKTLAALRFAL